MSHYSTLGVQDTASPVEIRRAYHRLARHAHPDHGGDVTRFQAIQLAWETLADPVKRAAYDTTLTRQQAHQRARYEQAAQTLNTAARRPHEQRYRERVDRLPGRISQHAPTPDKPGLKLSGLQRWYLITRVSGWVLILLTLVGIGSVFLLAHPNPTIALALGMITLVLLLPAAWLGWILVKTVSALLLRMRRHRVAFDADVTTFMEQQQK